jgi:hypothetical protein
MALHLELDAGDILVVPPQSGAQIRVGEKSGRRTRVTVESAVPVKVLRAKDEAAASAPVAVKRPVPMGPQRFGRPQ